MMCSDEEQTSLCGLNLLNILNENQKRVQICLVHPFWRENCHERSAFSMIKYLERFQRFSNIISPVYRFPDAQLVPRRDKPFITCC